MSSYKGLVKAATQIEFLEVSRIFLQSIRSCAQSAQASQSVGSPRERLRELEKKKIFYPAVRMGYSNTHFLWLFVLVVTCPRPSLSLGQTNNHHVFRYTG